METPNTYIELVFAYSAIWVCIVLFVIKLMKDQKNLNSEIEILKENEHAKK